MTPSTLTGVPVERDAEGFVADPSQWTEEMADDIARENGGSAPSIRTLGKVSGVPIKELYQLFPKGPAKLAAKIAGIPKPRGCI